MTGEEALKIIRAYKKKLENSCSNQLNEDIKAFDFAIRAMRIVTLADLYIHHNQVVDWEFLKEEVDRREVKLKEGENE